jgi:hypothetical protein
VVAWIGIVGAVALVAANGILIGAAAIPAMLLWTIATSVALWRDGSR